MATVFYPICYTNLMRPKKKTTYTDSQVGALMEHVDGKFDAIAEGISGLDAKIDRVDGKVEELRREMDYKFEVVFDELHIIRNDLKEKVGRDEFQLLEKRVATLEKRK